MAATEAKTRDKPLGYANILGANGGLEVWQRGAGASASIAVAASTTGYTADRWYLATGANQASTVSAQAGLANGSRLSARVQRNSGQTGTGVMRFAFPLDTDELIALRGEAIIVSFLISTGANWSPASGTLSVNVFCGTGAVGKRSGVAYTSETNPLTGSTNLSQGQAATKITIGPATVTVATNVTQAELQFSWTPAGTAGANDWFQIDDVQLEVGGIPMGFERRPFQQELMLCLPHYRTSFPYGTAPAQSGGVAGAVSIINPIAVGQPSYFVQFWPPMRASPTITTFNPSAGNANWRNVTAAADVAVSVDPASSKGPSGVVLAAGATVATIAQVLCIHYTADSSI